MTYSVWHDVKWEALGMKPSSSGAYGCQTHKHSWVWPWVNQSLCYFNLNGDVLFQESRKVTHANLLGDITNIYR